MEKSHKSDRLRLAELDVPRQDNLPATFANDTEYTSFTDDAGLAELINMANTHVVQDVPKTEPVTVTPTLSGITINANTVNIYYK